MEVMYPSSKLMSIKPTNRCTVSSARCTYHDFIQNGKQLWAIRVLDKVKSSKPFFRKAINNTTLYNTTVLKQKTLVYQ
jgi:hypothetical protein